MPFSKAALMPVSPWGKLFKDFVNAEGLKQLISAVYFTNKPSVGFGQPMWSIKMSLRQRRMIILGQLKIRKCFFCEETDVNMRCSCHSTQSVLHYQSHPYHKVPDIPDTCKRGKLGKRGSKIRRLLLRLLCTTNKMCLKLFEGQRADSKKTNKQKVARLLNCYQTSRTKCRLRPRDKEFCLTPQNCFFWFLRLKINFRR